MLIRPVSAVTLFLLTSVIRLSSAQDVTQDLPVENELVRFECDTCHEVDSENRMSRISYQRKTPEGWQRTLKRMIRVGNAQLTPEQAKQMVRYLSDHHGLAPSEARPAFYFAEKRPIAETPPTKEVEDTCFNRCHLGAWFLIQRRSPEEWKLLKGMHLGYFPLAEVMSFRGPEPSSQPPTESTEGTSVQTPLDKRWRVDRVLEYLGEHYSFDTPEWKAFVAKRTPSDVSGRWLLTTYQPGRGPVAGDLVIERSGEDYVTRAELLMPDGSVERREGKAVLYAGYTWRGSSKGTGLGELREVLMLSEDGTELEGRFFRGAYSEIGFDVKLTRLGTDPRIAGVSPRALPAAEGTSTLRILGANFPDAVQPEEVDFGPGVEVKAITSHRPNLVEVQVEVATEALPGLRDVSVGGATAVDGFAIYEKIDYVKVRPEEGLARLGGVRIPKQFAQFEAVAFHRGPDDEPLTDDDIELGPVEASWSLEEYHFRHDDDDVQYVGNIDQKGLFTPAVEGPNPERGTNNWGDVWVVASYSPPESSRSLNGRARLVVTCELLTIWESFP